MDHGRMAWDLYTKIIDDFEDICRREGFQGHLSYCNMSEPTVLKNFFDYLEYAYRKGCFYVYFNTNVSLLTPVFIDRLVAENVLPAIHLNIMSLQKEQYEEFMGIEFETTLKNLEHLAKHYDTDRVDAGVLSPPLNGDRVKEFQEFFKKRKIKTYVGKARDRAQNTLEEVHPITDKMFGCRANRPSRRMMVTYDGRVFLCDEDMANDVILGDLEKESIEEVWNGQRFREILQIIYEGKPTDPNFICYRCVNAVKVKPTFLQRSMGWDPE
jgi:radical SAM protein with 4Fe4S-binding SPASM domain